jgi:predicted nucleic acid-binding protein
VFITPQNLIEFWNAATHPVDRNGFGFTPAQADREVTQLEQLFPLAPDTPAIYGEWRQRVVSVGVSGVQVHDARLVAVMRAHGLTHILTFNTHDFVRYPGIITVHPQDVAIGP